MLDKLSWNKLLSVRSEGLELFVNTLTGNDKYSPGNIIGSIYRNKFKQDYLRNQKLFPNFSLRFWNLYQIVSILEKNISLLASVFSKLLTAKEVAT